MDIPNHEQLLATVEAFVERHGMADTRFGRDAINNPNFISGLRKGVSPTLDTLTKVMAYMKRIDAEHPGARPPLELTAPAQEEEIVLPFGTAPQSGASSPTSSPTNAARATSEASATCPSCSVAEARRSAPAVASEADAR